MTEQGPPRIELLVAEMMMLRKQGMEYRPPMNLVLWAVANHLEGIYLNRKSDNDAACKLNRFIEKLADIVEVKFSTTPGGASDE